MFVCTDDGICNNAIAQDAKMKTFVDGLMKKMTLDEKIGQLNLLTPGRGISYRCSSKYGC